MRASALLTDSPEPQSTVTVAAIPIGTGAHSGAANSPSLAIAIVFTVLLRSAFQLSAQRSIEHGLPALDVDRPADVHRPAACEQGLPRLAVDFVAGEVQPIDDGHAAGEVA